MRPRKPDSRKPRSAPSSRPAQPVGKEGKRPRFGEERPETRSARPDKNPGRPPHKGADQRKGKYPARPNRDDTRRDGPPREARPTREASWQKPRERSSAKEPPRPPRPERRDERRDDRPLEAPRHMREPLGRDRADYGRGPDQRLRDQRSRDRSGRPDLPVWLYGSHACLAALGNPERSFRRLLLTREAREALQDDLPADPQPEIVDRSRLESLLPPGAVHQGIALLVDPLDDGGIEGLKDELPEGHDIVLLLDHVTDPRNIGAILRSAAAFGARAVVVTDRHAPEATGALAKAASGALEKVPLIRVTNLARALDQLAEYGYWRVGLEMETEKTLAEAVRDIRRTALVLGAEDEGLRRLTREKCDFLARLPITDAMESLNVSAAAAVALYECVRG